MLLFLWITRRPRLLLLAGRVAKLARVTVRRRSRCAADIIIIIRAVIFWGRACPRRVVIGPGPSKVLQAAANCAVVVAGGGGGGVNGYCR